MTNIGNWPFLDRLTNDEFFDLIPHLSLENSFLTQIFLPTKKWVHMLDANFNTFKVYCGCCEEQFGFDAIKNHLTQKNHLKSLRCNSIQFYQPFFTFGKGDIKLARGEQISLDRREIALRELNTQMKSFKKDFILAKQFVDIVQSETQKSEEERFLQLSLKMKVEKPEQMFVMVCLPFNDIPKIHFCNTGGKWQPVFSYKYLTKKAKFSCNICDLNCSGIGSLNSHLNGFTHKLRQLQLSTLQYEVNSQLNKNCCFYFGEGFTYSVKKDAWEFFGEENNSSQLPKLSKEIKRKVNALSEYVSKIFTHSIGNIAADQIGKFECNEYLGHLGVEYVLKILQNNDPDTKFECGLCEFVGDEIKMQRHILNYDHKKKYLDLHYSDTMKKYETLLGHMRYMKFRAVISEIVDKLAVEVEKQHSRSLPYTVSLRDYTIRRPEVIAEVYALLHASQNRGPSFSNVLSKDDLQNLKNSAVELAESTPYKTIEFVIFTTAPKDKVYLNQLSHDPVVRLREYNAKMIKNRSARSGRSMTPTKSSTNSHNDRVYTLNQEHRSRSRSPISFRRRSPLEQNFWDIYRRERAVLANEIEKDYEGYRKNPESHPLYEEEWNKFWQRRKHELELEGINHRTHNFQPEWVHYFKQRIEKLFEKALQESEINIRRKLDIPLHAVEDSQRSHHLNKEPENKQIEEFNEFRRRKRIRSFDYEEGLSGAKPLSDEKCGKKLAAFTTNKMIRDNHSNVVHVLRLITALEEHLGSLGGKIMDLLSNALQMEKHFQGNSLELEANILTTTNCQLLETAVEKLKGILFAGLLDHNKISSFNHVIQYTTNLLKYAEKKGWRQDTIPLLSTYHCRANKKLLQEQMNSIQTPNEKPLSDTLMDLMNASHTNIRSIHAAKEFYSTSEVCPPPPDIKFSDLNPALFSLCKRQSLNSGLASFDTKLSIDASNQKKRFGQSSQTDIKRLNIDPNAGVNILNNKSFKNNNETRTNAKNRPNTGSKIGGSINNNCGSLLQLRNSQAIPNLVQNNAMCQRGVGGNRNQNWSLWNNN